MRWLMLLIAVAGFSFAYVTKSPEVLMIALVAGFGGLIGAFLGFAAARVAATARPDVAMLSDQDIAKLRASIKKPRPPTT